MKRTIIIRVEENVDCNTVFWSTPTGHKLDHHMTVAEAFGLKWDCKTNSPISQDIDIETTMDALHDRLERIAQKHRIRIKRLGVCSWSATMRIITRKTHRFPTASGDGTKWGPVDFYDDVRDNVFAAVRSGLDFSTDWLACKKEPVSCRITRELNKTYVEVSVCGEEDAYGDASVTTQLHKKLTDDEILRRLERAAHKAWDIANRELEAWVAMYGNCEE